MIDVKALAKQAGFVTSDVFGALAHGVPVNSQLEAFASLVLEAAAVECETHRHPRGESNEDRRWQAGTASCASHIRAMKPKGDV